MLKIHDGRDNNECRLEEIWIDGFFIYKDVVCRRIDCSHVELRGEGIPYIEMPSAVVGLFPRDIWVEPIPEKQIYLEIED